MKTAILSRVRLRPAPEPAADAELLERFIAERDKQAFSALVHRHGPQVLGVCRRVTGDHHLAEDAFFVLAAKAGTMRPRSALPAWLYGLAYPIALRARTMQGRRRRREATVATLPEPASVIENGADAADLIAALDAEIAALPESQRGPVVMCELEGRSRKEAAADLGISEGTLSSRLARARTVLAARLRRRGIALSAAGLTTTFAQLAPAMVSERLSTSTVAGAIGHGPVAAPVANLAQGALRVMFIQKLKQAALATVMLTVALIVTAELLATPSASKAPTPAAAPTVKAPNGILLFRDGHLVLMDSDGGNERKLTKERLSFYRDARVSPDGKQIALFVLVQDDEEKKKLALDGAQKLVVRSLDGQDTDLDAECKMFAWSPDGNEIVCNQFVDGPKGRDAGTSHFIVNVKTRKQTALKLPDGHFINDWSRDGKHFLTTCFVANEKQPQLGRARLFLLNRDGTEHRALGDENQFCIDGRLSPDGKRVMYGVATFPKDEKEDPKIELAVLDIESGKSVMVGGLPASGELLGFSWSPDGKRIAYTWRDSRDGDKETKSRLVVCDPDGRNAKTIASQAGADPTVVTIGRVDWR